MITQEKLTIMSTPSHYNNNSNFLETVRNQVVIFDRSDWGLIELTGGDRARFLHNQSTNQIIDLQPGQSRETVFVNSTGRTLDLVTVYATPEALWLLVSPDSRQFLYEWMDRYIFPLDAVELKDISEDYAIFTLIGGQSASVLSNIGLNTLLESNHHTWLDFDNTPILVANGCDLDLPGFTLIVPINHSQTIWTKLVNTGITVLEKSQWSQLRILQGRPERGYELTEDYNPLEAGLWRAISFNKGCYIGQETIARLNTYRGVKQRLWGIVLDSPVEPGTVITLDEKKVGIVTSVTNNFALGYIRTQAGGEGLKVTVDNTTGIVVEVPFLSHDYYL